ncbi:MAG: RAD55 family ATPase [Pyrobaculum sp.]
MDLGFTGVTAIYGRPGVGKTSLAMRIAHERLNRGERVLWVSLYEDKETFIKNATALGYDLSKINFWDMIFVKTDVMINQVVSAVSQENYDLVVADSLSSLLEGSKSREYLINAVYRVFKPSKTDFLAIAEEESVTPLDYVSDNLLRLEMKITNGVTERRMYVVKSRGKKAGYYLEFDIIEGQGVVFIDELPRPAPRPSWEAWAESLSRAFGPIRGGSIYMLLGKVLTPLLARAAAELSQQRLKVLYRALSRDASVVSKLVERYGGRAEVQQASPRPQSHFAHVKSLYEALTNSSADVVISDGVDVEFLLYGRKAFEINFFEIRELKSLGVALFLGCERSWGLRHLADYVAVLKGAEAVVYAPHGREVCKVEDNRIHC